MAKYSLRAAIIAVVVASILGNVAAYPGLFVAGYSNGDCTAQPVLGQSYGPHAEAGPVAIDSTIVFEVSENGVITTGSLCAGHSYQVKVALPGGRAYLLTISQGTWQDGRANCPNRVLSPIPTDTVIETLNLPCSALGTAEIVITSAQGALYQHLQNRISLSIDPTCKLATCA